MRRQRNQQREHLGRFRFVHAGGRFIAQQNAWTEHQGARDLHAPAVRIGETACGLIDARRETLAKACDSSPQN